MNQTALCQFLDYDSDFFGFRIARVIGEHLTPQRWAGILAWCRHERIRCLYFLSAPDDDQTTRVAEEAGFHLVDLRVKLLWRTRDGVAVPAPPLPLRPFQEADLSALQAIAASAYTTTRFYYDLRFTAARAADFYRKWVERDCHGRASAVFVAPSLSQNQRPRGFVTCCLGASDGASISLLGVRDDERGAGIGRALVSAGQSYFARSGAEQVSVVTQGRNLVAQRLYQSCGFRTAAVGLWYHRWFETEA